MPPGSVADPSGCGVWEPEEDLQTGKIYWTNHALQKTTWDPPNGGGAQGGPPPVAGPAGPGAPTGGAMPASVADPSGCGVWEPGKDLQTGKIYWTNHALQKTTWDPPNGGRAGGA
jgi:hypothetical protein